VTRPYFLISFSLCLDQVDMAYSLDVHVRVGSS
jgi:hypothetical protein